MAHLSLIVGPPNAGKAGAIRARLEAALAQDPVLVVPTLDDTGRFELELCQAAGEGGSVLGVAIRTFDRLFDDVALATGATLPPVLTRAQRLHVIRLAVAAADLQILRRSARRPGFPAAVADLLDDVQSAGLDPQTLAANAGEAEGAAYLAEIAALYRSYAESRDRIGSGDAHTAAERATAALRANPDAWGGRPVLFYGFDDLTPAQLELVAALATAADVTFAVPYEDRLAYRARAGLHERLRDLGGVVESELRPDAANTESRTLFELERRFLREQTSPVVADESLVLLEAAGERNQAEQIGSEVARLLADGVTPDQIAVVVRDPNRDGPLLDAVFDAFGIPAAVEARLPLRATATGRGLLALIRVARPGASAQDLLQFLRSPAMARPAAADWLERRILRESLRTGDEARTAWEGERELFELADLAAATAAGAPAVLRTLARFARRIAERPWERQASCGERTMRLELRAGAAAAAALEELAEVPTLEDPFADALAALDALEVSLWLGPSEGHVLVTSPYRIRARRVEHLFVASLQEGEFPRHETGEPFLSDDQRGALRLPERADPDDEERYLFAICLSRPTRRLHLCWRSSDDEGTETAPSPFLDDLRDLLPEPADGEDPLAERVRRRRLADVVTPLGDAPSFREVARALAAAGGTADPAAIMGLAASDAQVITAQLEAARAHLRRDRPGPLQVPAVLAELEQRELFGASTLEGYAECSYRWFVAHELRPRELEPEPEMRAQGSVIHAVLERIYREPPVGRRPEPATLDAWRARTAELVNELAAERGLGGDDARALAARARMQALIEGQLEREAGTSTPLLPDPELLEASFGETEEDIAAPLDLGDGVRLHGMIDRVDVSPGGAAALVRDYKVARVVTIGKNLEKEGKLQPQLYALALEQLWGKRPLGGLYQPLAGTKEHTPRGIAAREEAEPGGLLEGLGLRNGDLIPDDELREKLEEGAARAREIAGQMRAGRITRDPLEDRCPTYCTFQAICRRERAARIEPEPGADEEEEQE
jgi:ATP-dependent helicase/DNAse subunit B